MKEGFLGLDENCLDGGVPVELFRLLRGVNKNLFNNVLRHIFTIRS